jgi:ankyrin repeat protein
MAGFLEVEKYINPRDKDGYTPLHTAASNCNLDITQLIIEAIESKKTQQTIMEKLHSLTFY